MGKGEIISNYGYGQYLVKIIYGGRDRLTARIAILDDAIANLESRIAAETDGGWSIISSVMRQRDGTVSYA